MSAAVVSDVVRGFLDDDGWGWVPGEQEGYPTLETGFRGNTAAWPVVVRVFDDFGQVAVESVLPFTVGTGERAAVLELISRANLLLLTGAFHLNLDDGTLRFRTSLLLPDHEPLTAALCKGMLYANVLTVDRCYPEVAAVAAGDLEPAAAATRLAL
jgi:hypothetical protein